MRSRMARLCLRMVFLLIGAGLALSLGLLDATVIVLMHQSAALPLWAVALLGAIIVVVPLFVIGLLPVVRTIEGAAAQSLLQVQLPDGIPEPAYTWPQRWRTFGWSLMHLLAGGAISVVVMVAIRVGGWWSVCLAAATVVIALMFIAIFVRLAPRALGPSSSERLARLEQDFGRAVERDRIAREIHDSIGHALSLVTVQAGAARRVIERDPEFAVSALAAIEDASRRAAADLDHALGLLREDDAAAAAPTPDLTDLPMLVQAIRAAGLDISWECDVDPTMPPLLVSREAYRIVQEALTNALRYSLDGAATLRLDGTNEQVSIVVENRAEQRTRGRRGRGLRGVAERVDTLGGSLDAGLLTDHWRLVATLPAHPGGRT